MRDQQVIPGWTAIELPRSKQTGVPSAERRRNIEHWEQTELFRFLSLFYKRYPHLEWIYSSGNGLFLGDDEGAKRRAADAVRAGLRKGVWDVCVPFPRLVGGVLFAHGMYIEMKTNTNDLTVDQERFGVVMQRNGHVCFVARSWHEAARMILEYLGDCPAALIALADATPAPKQTVRILKGAAKRSASVPLSERTAVQRSYKRKTVADKETKEVNQPCPEQ